jgi:DNA (cytosine-5)-methyltransferase 1
MPLRDLSGSDQPFRLLDLFCGAGGAAMGYHRAGFEVVGVDIEPQPNYPFRFVQMDALKLIENVEGAPLENPTRLCGSSFGLDVQRHRLFETNWPLFAPPCSHGWAPARFPGATNREPSSRRTVEVGVWRIPFPVQKRAMGVDWDCTLEELSKMVPPAYTEFIGRQLALLLEAGDLEAAA